MDDSRTSIRIPLRPKSGIAQHMDPPGTREWNIATIWTSNRAQPHAICFYTLSN
jgi:hypothetical protein